VSLFNTVSDQLQLGLNGYAMFFDALPFRFYCMLMILFVFTVILTGRDFGPMRLAEQKVREQGGVSDIDAKIAVTNRGHAANAIIPLAALLLSDLAGLWIDGAGLAKIRAGDSFFTWTHWRSVISDGTHSPVVLACAALISLSIALLCARLTNAAAWWQLRKAVTHGAKRALMPIAILTLAWSLKTCTQQVGTAEFLISILQERVSPHLFPAILFAVASAISFATGTSYGTMAILIPTAIPIAFALDGSTYGITTMISLGAVLDGAIFGDHCSPISDTTILSTTASNCPLMDHVRTQLPYSLYVAAIALSLAYLPAAFGLKSRYTILLAATTMIILLLLLVRNRQPRRMPLPTTDTGV
jgi:Na+/H+ antiporter NhaC